MRDPERDPVDVERVGELEPADHEADQIRRHRDRVLEADPDHPVAGRFACDLGAVRERGEPFPHDQRDAEHGLEVRLVPAREGAPRVGGLEVAGRDHVSRAVLFVGRPVVAHEVLVEARLGREMQNRIARIDR